MILLFLPRSDFCLTLCARLPTVFRYECKKYYIISPYACQGFRGRSCKFFVNILLLPLVESGECGKYIFRRMTKKAAV